MQNVSSQIAKGAAWMVLLKLMQRGLGIISTFILVRLLVPSDFGLIAMAMSVIAITELMGAFGFEVALIHNQNANHTHYNTVWTFNVLFGLGSALVLFALAYPASIFYNEPRLVYVMSALALAPLINGFENIGLVIFRKEMRFDKDFVFLLTKKLSGFLLAIPLAFILRSHWALVVGIITSHLAGTICSYLMHPYRPRFSLAAWNELFHFSKWMFFLNIFGFIRYRAANIIIGKIAGTYALGLFEVSYEISNAPTTELSAPINRAVFPGYAKISHNLQNLRQEFLNVLSMLALFAMPLGVGVAAIAEPFVHVALGPKWVAAVPVMQLLAFSGVVAATESNSASVYYALGKPRMLVFVHGIAIIVLIPLCIYLTTLYGIIGTAFSYLVTALISLPLNYLILFRNLQLRFREFLSVVWRPLIAVTSMYVTVYLFLENSSSGLFFQSKSIQLFTAIFIGALSYSTILILLWILSGKPRGSEKVILGKSKVFLYKCLRTKSSILAPPE